MLNNNSFLSFIRSNQIFYTNNNSQMSISDHLNELRQRFFVILIVFLGITAFSCLFLQDLIRILQKPAIGIKFLQLAPGEYFFVSIKVALYSGFIISSPFAVFQSLLFILPGLTRTEVRVFIPILISSLFLFFLGIFFGYSVLIPAALHFLIAYGSDIIEPLWSFEQYFDFVSMILITTGITFQIPILQVILGLFNIISSMQMLAIWQYIVLLSTIIGAIITPSTDPITQLILTAAILILYFIGIGILVYIKK